MLLWSSITLQGLRPMWAALGLYEWILFGLHRPLNILTRIPIGSVCVLQLASDLTVLICFDLAASYIACLILQDNFIFNPE